MSDLTTVALKGLTTTKRTYNLYVEITDRDGNEWIIDQYHTFPDDRMTEMQERRWLRESFARAVLASIEQSMGAESLWGVSIGDPTITLLPPWQQAPMPKWIPSPREQLRQSGLIRAADVRSIGEKP